MLKFENQMFEKKRYNQMGSLKSKEYNRTKKKEFDKQRILSDRFSIFEMLIVG